ncbi:MAG: adenylate/guanylate cyclase domain-containing protein, partial [Chthoniobacterales bacterium]
LLAVAGAYYALTFGVARVANHVLELIQPTSTLLIAGFGCIAWNFAAERRESGRMRSTLERYVSRNVVREILDHRDDFLNALGGTRRPMTVFFSDVRGFTSFSEQSDASDVVTQLNEYLAAMVRIIFAHEGTVDKFMGDGIMAVWGNVVSNGAAADACRAARAAHEMQSALARLNTEWAARDLPAFAIGIGLHHGDAVFGNIGSDEKMEPTVIGDAVNLASRVEGLTKKYGVVTCITGSCAELVREDFHLRTVDLVQVVGKTKPVEIFSLISPTEVQPPTWLEPWENAIRLFRGREFAAAIRLLEALHFDAPDKLRDLYLARCEAYLQTPPPSDWTGTEIATTK